MESPYSFLTVNLQVIGMVESRPVADFLSVLYGKYNKAVWPKNILPFYQKEYEFTITAPIFFI